MTENKKKPARKKRPAPKLPAHWAAANPVARYTDELVPYAANSRTHSREQVKEIAGLIEEFGWTNPVLIDEKGVIRAGHGRILAADLLGIEVVPCIIAKGWSEAQLKAYVIADNKSAEHAGWNDELLSIELQALAEMDYDLKHTAVTDNELNELLGKVAKDSNEDNVPEKPDPQYSVSRPGDVWVMGMHRLIVGSCTDPATVKKLLGTVKPTLMVADPPYGVNYDPEWRNEKLKEKGKSTGKVKNDDIADWSEAWKLFPGQIAYVWHADLANTIVRQSLEAVGFQIRNQIIWVKPHFTLSRGHYNGEHEPCYYAVKKGRSADWSGDNKQSTVWRVDNGLSQGGERKSEDENTPHSTQKPVELYRRAIVNHTSEGQAVYDPFGGSGTIIIACEVTGRTGFACELDTGYADVIVSRWQTLTGDIAMNEEGMSFEQVAAERKKK